MYCAQYSRFKSAHVDGMMPAVRVCTRSSTRVAQVCGQLWRCAPMQGSKPHTHTHTGTHEIMHTPDPSLYPRRAHARIYAVRARPYAQARTHVRTHNHRTTKHSDSTGAGPFPLAAADTQITHCARDCNLLALTRAIIDTSGSGGWYVLVELNACSAQAFAQTYSDESRIQCALYMIHNLA